VRVARTILSIAALCWGFAQAPFLHIHPEEHDHAAASLAHVHSHESRQGSDLAIDTHTPDDDAIDVDWHIAAPQAVVVLPELSLAAALVVPPPVVAPAPALVEFQPRGHDPPDITPKQPRSPPV